MKVMRCLLVAALVGCGDHQPAGVAPEPLLGWPVARASGLLRCTPLAPDSASQTIGPAGGVLRVGPHVFSIPPGALTSTVTITAVIHADSVNRIHFEPQGLAFTAPTLLTMSYANCDVLSSLVPKHIAYTSDALVILELVPTVDNLLTQKVTGSVVHFSDYAIAW